MKSGILEKQRREQLYTRYGNQGLKMYLTAVMDESLRQLDISDPDGRLGKSLYFFWGIELLTDRYSDIVDTARQMFKKQQISRERLAEMEPELRKRFSPLYNKENMDNAYRSMEGLLDDVQSDPVLAHEKPRYETLCVEINASAGVLDPDIHPYASLMDKLYMGRLVSNYLIRGFPEPVREHTEDLTLEMEQSLLLAYTAQNDLGRIELGNPEAN